MAEITIDDDLAQQVITLAEQGQSSVNAVLRAMLEAYTEAHMEQKTISTPSGSNWVAEMGRMADEDTTGVWDSFSLDLSERSREILDSEFASYLLKRSDSSADND